MGTWGQRHGARLWQALVFTILVTSGCVRILDLPPGLPIEGRVVREVRIADGEKGNSEEIVDGLESHPPEGLVRIQYNLYDPDAVAADKLRIQSYYQRQGYFAAKVVGIETYPVRERYVDLVFKVERGKPTRIRELAIAGLPRNIANIEEQAFTSLGIAIGDRYREESYLLAKRSLGKAISSAGYPYFEIEGKVLVDRANRIAALRFLVTTGPRVRFGDAGIDGLEYFPSNTVAKRIAWDKGEIYTPDLVAKTRRDILALQRFATVQINLNKHDDETVFPQIVARESKRNEVRIGGGFACDPVQTRVRGRAGYVRRGFLSPLNTLTIDLRPAYAFDPVCGSDSGRGIEGGGFVGELLASVERLDFPADFFSSRIEGGYEVDEIEAFASRGPRLRLATERRFFNQRVFATVGWQLSLDDFFEIRVLDQQEAGIPDRLRVGAFFQQVSVDFRDQVLQPTRGFFGSVSLEEGTRFAGGENFFVRLAPELRGYFAPWSRLVLAARLAGGVDLVGDDLPVTRRFFSGGASRHRGFPQRTLSPTVDSDDGTSRVAVGGAAMFESNLEARLRVYGRYGIVGFLDAGDARRRLANIAFGNLHVASGLGLRIQTPVGPVRVDLGVRLNRLGGANPRPNDQFVFHLSLGEAF